MDLNSFIFFFVLIFFGYFFNKYFGLILNKYKPGLLIDSQFKKPQAFHDFPVSISGGIDCSKTKTLCRTSEISFEDWPQEVSSIFIESLGTLDFFCKNCSKTKVVIRC